MQVHQAGAGGDTNNTDAGGDKSRRTQAEILADLVRERDAEIEKSRKKFDAKIAKARKSATPVGDRRRTALDYLDRLRDTYRTAYGDVLLDESVVDREITSIFIGALNANDSIKPEALHAAMLVLDGKADDDTGTSDVDGVVTPGAAALAIEGLAQENGSASELPQGAATDTGGDAAGDESAGGEVVAGLAGDSQGDGGEPALAG
jgi:hypothetical protein